MWIMICGPYRSGAADEPTRQAGAARYDDIMLPLSLALIERCDAALRVGGASSGADSEIERFKAQGKPVYYSEAEII